MFLEPNLRRYRYWMAGAVLLVVTVAGWMSWPRSEHQEAEADDGVSTMACSDLERPLYPAVPPLQGADVEELQDRLKELGFYNGDIDGIYGQKTIDAVKQMQKQKGLKADGYVAEETWQLLDTPLAAGRTETKTVTPAPKGKITIRVDIYKHTLTVFADGQVHKTYPISTGKAKTPSPVGEWKIVDKQKGWGGGFGNRWLGLNVPWGIYGIHGTDKPWSIGKSQSHGCFRMHNKHVEEMFSLIPVGTIVEVINSQPVKFSKKTYRRGESGQDVAYLQKRLREMGFTNGLADGRFGPATEEAVKALQTQNNLTPDGIVTDQVLKIMGFGGG